MQSAQRDKPALGDADCKLAFTTHHRALGGVEGQSRVSQQLLTDDVVSAIWMSMPRSVRIEYEGAFYHVMARGNRREAIFRDREDRLYFLKALSETSGMAGWRVHKEKGSVNKS